ncbi:hypothetical protein BDV19DRAFT_385890 [Aspergillus venezuelensis]
MSASVTADSLLLHHESPNKPPNLHVVIIGGVITGLTLAHCLDAAGVNYTLPEKHASVSRAFGGSIGLQANGCRILEQLGLYEKLEPLMKDNGFIANTIMRSGFTLFFPADIINWFVFIKLDRTYSSADASRWSREEVHARLEAPGAHTIVSPHAFRDSWSITDADGVYCVPVHEGMVEVATPGRVICIGDSAYKMSPYIAKAGKLCMESAAALANNLRRLSHDLDYNHTQSKSGETKIGISEEQIYKVLSQTIARYTERLRQMSNISYTMTRIISLDGWRARSVYRYIMPPLVGLANYWIMRRLEAGVVLDYFPMPVRARLAAGG